MATCNVVFSDADVKHYMSYIDDCLTRGRGGEASTGLRALVRVLSAEGRVQNVIRLAVEREMQLSVSPESLFREDCAAIKLIQVELELAGIAGFLDEIYTKFKRLVNSLPENWNEVTVCEAAHLVITDLSESIQAITWSRQSEHRAAVLHLGTLMKILQHEASREYGKRSVREFASTFFFLRLALPHLMQARSINLHSHSRFVTEVIRLLQGLVNGRSLENVFSSSVRSVFSMPDLTSEKHNEVIRNLPIREDAERATVKSALKSAMKLASSNDFPGLHVSSKQLKSAQQVLAEQLDLLHRSLISRSVEAGMLLFARGGMLNSTGRAALIRDIHKSQKRDLGMIVTPLEPHIVIPELAGVLWAFGRECLILQTAGIAPVLLELVQAAVSEVNRCKLCLDMHSMLAMAHGLSYSDIYALVREEAAGKSFANKYAPYLPILKWARVSNDRYHQLNVNVPFGPLVAPEFFAAAFNKHYLNRITSSFLRAFTQARGKTLKGLVFRVLSGEVRGAMNSKTGRIPGESFRFAAAFGMETSHSCLESVYSDYVIKSSAEFMDLAFDDNINYEAFDDSEERSQSSDNLLGLADASGSPTVVPVTGFGVQAVHGSWIDHLPQEFAWARSRPEMAELLVRWNILAEAMAHEVMGPAPLQMIFELLETWDGKSLPAQTDSVLAKLESIDRIGAELAIATIFTPNEVSMLTMDRFANLYPENVRQGALFCLMSSMAYFAARKIASFWKIPEYGLHSSSMASQGSHIYVVKPDAAIQVRASAMPQFYMVEIGFGRVCSGSKISVATAGTANSPNGTIPIAVDVTFAPDSTDTMWLFSNFPGEDKISVLLFVPKEYFRNGSSKFHHSVENTDAGTLRIKFQTK